MNTVAIHTLGCKLNFSESSDLARRFVENGFRVVDFKQRADVYIINTCTVTALAEKKCRNIIRQAIALNPDAIVAAIGCFAQNNAQEIEKIEGVDYILGNNDKHKLLEYILNPSCGDRHKKVLPMGKNDVFVPTYSTGDRTRSFFKVQDGCNYFCTYCAIPFARGRNRSLNVEDTVAKAWEIAQHGMKEVVLTGIHISSYGIDFEKVELPESLTEFEYWAFLHASIPDNTGIFTMVEYYEGETYHVAIYMRVGNNPYYLLVERSYTNVKIHENTKYQQQQQWECPEWEDWYEEPSPTT